MKIWAATTFGISPVARYARRGRGVRVEGCCRLVSRKRSIGTAALLGSSCEILLNTLNCQCRALTVNHAMTVGAKGNNTIDSGDD